jgi:hypothetical protein
MEPYIIILPYIIGTLIGLYFGFKSGVRTGSENTIDALMQRGFLKYKETAEGLIEFIKVK